MKYYIFGGSGFVGHSLVEALLADGKEVCNCDLVRNEWTNDSRGGHSFQLTSQTLMPCGQSL